jgi:hypothetical protein
MYSWLYNNPVWVSFSVQRDLLVHDLIGFTTNMKLACISGQIVRGIAYNVDRSPLHFKLWVGAIYAYRAQH